MPPVKAEQFKGGQSNPTYRLTDGAGRRYVLRRKPPGKLLPSAHAVDREFRVISALNKTDVPTPRAYALCEDDSVVGTAFYVMEYCDGRVLWDPLLPELPKEAGSPSIAPSSRSWPGCTPSTTWPLALPTSAGRALRGAPDLALGKQYKASETEKIESMDRLLDWLPAHLPADDETVLVHGDYRLDNMIFHPTEPRVLGIIDWEISTLGDPLAELSYLCMLWRTPKDWGGLKGHDLAALGLPTEQEMVAYYCGSRNVRCPIRRSGNSTWPTISSACRAFARVSMPARSTAPRPTCALRSPASWYGRPPTWPGRSSTA